MSGFFDTAGGIHSRTLLTASLLALTLWGLSGWGLAHATRWGPPWQGEVAAQQTVVYTQPDRASTPVGPLGRGAVVVVLSEEKDASGDDWLEIPDGYLPAEDVDEKIDPWIAEVSVPSASVYAKPFEHGGIRRTARQGALLRVTGVSPGLEGDGGVWWATTEGYLRLNTVRAATGQWAEAWTIPDPAKAASGWWGSIRGSANVRAGATTESPVLGTFAGGEHVKVLSEEKGESIRGNDLWYLIDGGRFAGARVHSSLIGRLPDPRPNTTPPGRGAAVDSWIVVDRSAATLTLMENGQPRFVTYVSIGKAGAATPTGTYGTFGKFRADDMSSTTVANPTSSYDLPNVPFTQYYKEGGFAIHGTYWHDAFGGPESQGCINLGWTDGAYLFGLTDPGVPDGVVERWSALGAATQVVIVD